MVEVDFPFPISAGVFAKRSILSTAQVAVNILGEPLVAYIYL
jgi:hypothetical protein